MEINIWEKKDGGKIDSLGIGEGKVKGQNELM